MEIITTLNGTEYVLFEHAPNEFTSMPKSVYDEQQAALSTPNFPPE
jgi:hypothetical protein